MCVFELCKGGLALFGSVDGHYCLLERDLFTFYERKD